MPHVLPVSPAAAAAVLRGHPWIFNEPTGDLPVGEVVQLRDRKRVVGWGLVDRGEITARVLGVGPAPGASLAEVVRSRVADADAARWRMVLGDTDCWRVVFGAGDGLPGLVVDRYADLAVLRVYAAAWEPHLDVVVAAIAKLPWVTTVFRRFGVRRVDGRDGGETLSGPEAPARAVVREDGMRFLVRPWVGQKTGLFLDQRAHRAAVRALAPGRTTVNLFSYTGGFSVAAALGGAAHVTTVDLAPEAVEDARENFALNGLEPSEHTFTVADAFKWRPRAPVDLLIVDPPALTRGARSDASAARAYTKLHANLGGSVSGGGLMVSSSCTARLTLAEWRTAVAQGLAQHGAWSWHGASTHAVDHPVALAHDEGWYLKFGVLRRRRGL